MSFFHKIISDIEQREDADVGPRTSTDLDAFLKFAPKKTRLQRANQLAKLESDLRDWQKRAIRAEARLRFLEGSVQQIAKRYARRDVDISRRG